MADVSDSDSSSQSSSSSSSRDRHAQQWNALCDVLGTSDPNEVLARVQTLKRKMERTGETPPQAEGLVTISEVEEVFREMNRKIENLRERNAELAERLEDEDDDASSAFHELHQKTERLLEVLDVTTMDEARDRIQQLHHRLEILYREKETLVEAGLSDAQDALDEIERLRDERDILEEELRKRPASSSSRSPDPDTSVLEAAAVIRDRIGLSTPAQAEALTRVTEHLYEQIQNRAEAYDVGVDDTPENVVDMLHSMATQLNALPSPDALPAEAADVLGVASTSEAQALTETIRRVSHRVLEQYKDAVELEKMDAEADDAVTLLHTLEDRIRALRDSQPSSTESEALPAEVGEILGIRSVEDARELDRMIARLTDRLQHLESEHEQLEEVGLSVDGALTMIENMGAQLAELYGEDGQGSNGTSAPGPHRSILDEGLRQRLAEVSDTAPEAADNIMEMVRSLLNQINQLSNKQAPFLEAGPDAKEAVTLIESMETQLNELYREKQENEDAADRLSAIDDVLGITTREEAEELSQWARRMEDQLTTLYQEKKKLEQIGVSTVGDAVDMIRSMEEQLADLYEDKEALRQAQLGGTEHQSTFQQLEALYAERQQLQQALGVSGADAVIEMVESLNSQLEAVYTPRDAEVDREERHDASLWAPEAEPAAYKRAEASSDEDEREEVEALTLNSMEHQLEALYREKETLLDHGFRSAQAAVDQLQTQQKQIDALQRENHSYERRFDRLESELGTKSVPQVVELVRALESEAERSVEDLRPSGSGASVATEYGIDIEAVSPFVSEETLSQLDELPASELDALDAGVVQLSEAGTVEYLNEAALRLPGLQSIDDRRSVVGENFFLELAPSTNNNLFFGRFRKGQRRGAIDARFPYTFTSPNEGPETFSVHLYRAPDADSTWLLFHPA